MQSPLAIPCVSTVLPTPRSPTNVGLTMIEWANLIAEILPEHYHQILIEKDLEKGFDYRKITIQEIGGGR